MINHELEANNSESRRQLFRVRTGLRCVDSAKGLYAWISFILFVCCNGMVQGQAGASCSAQDTASLLSAILYGCPTITIPGEGFKMEQSVVVSMLANLSEHRVRVYRNTTIRGELPYTLWDVAYLKRRIGIESGVVVTLESLFITHSRQPGATSYGSMDIFTMEAASTLIYRNVTMVYPLCIPIPLAAQYTPLVERPPGYTNGVQTAYQGGPVCFPDVDYPQKCFNDSMVLESMAVWGSSMDSYGVRTINGVVLELHSTYVCAGVVSFECIANKTGTPTCVAQAVERLNLTQWQTYDLVIYPPPPPPVPPPPPPVPPPPPPAPLRLDSSMGTGTLLAIVLPSVIGGLAVLAALAGALLLWRRQRGRRRSDSGSRGDACQNGYSKASNGMTHGSVDGPSLGGRPNSQPCLEGGGPQHSVMVARGTGATAAGAGSAGPDRPPFSDDGVNQKWFEGQDAKGGGSGPSKMSSGVHRSTLSLGNSGYTAGGIPSTGYGGVPDSLLGNPLLPAQGGKLGSNSSGSAIALNLVLGVDVMASREAVIGRGTYATVLEGQMSGRPVAVKLFHRDALGGTSNDVKTLGHEIAILARCQHPNVVTLLGAGSTPGGDEVFLVEELMVSNLSRVCHEGNGLPLQQVLSVARDVAAGLAYLHPTVIHRDLKPANVLLDPHGTAKLTDFGLSRLWASTVHTAHPEAGTVQYMAPECFSDSLSPNTGLEAKTPISHNSDIYSFGVLLWEMLSRERPWKGLTSIQVALTVGLQQHRLSLPESDERFHPKLRKLILQCWDQDPRKRPGAAEIAKRLSLLLQHLQTYGSLGGPLPGSGGGGGAAASLVVPTSADMSQLGSYCSDPACPCTPGAPGSSGSMGDQQPPGGGGGGGGVCPGGGPAGGGPAAGMPA